MPRFPPGTSDSPAAISPLSPADRLGWDEEQEVRRSRRLTQPPDRIGAAQIELFEERREPLKDPDVPVRLRHDEQHGDGGGVPTPLSGDLRREALLDAQRSDEVLDVRDVGLLLVDQDRSGSGIPCEKVHASSLTPDVEAGFGLGRPAHRVELPLDPLGEERVLLVLQNIPCRPPDGEFQRQAEGFAVASQAANRCALDLAQLVLGDHGARDARAS